MQDETRSRLEPRLSPIAPFIYRFILDDNRPIFGQRSPPDRPAAQRAQETGVIWIAAPRRGSVLRLLSATRRLPLGYTANPLGASERGAPK